MERTSILSFFLCGSLRISAFSAFSALKALVDAENAEIRRGPQRRTHKSCRFQPWQNLSLVQLQRQNSPIFPHFSRFL